MNRPILKYTKTLSDNQAPKILPSSNRLRLEIVKILKEENDGVKLHQLQNILKVVLKKYDVTGFAVYSELKDMIAEGILKIDNDELNNESSISINT